MALSCMPGRTNYCTLTKIIPGAYYYKGRSVELRRLIPSSARGIPIAVKFILRMRVGDQARNSNQTVTYVTFDLDPLKLTLSRNLQIKNRKFARWRFRCRTRVEMRLGASGLRETSSYVLYTPAHNSIDFPASNGQAWENVTSLDKACNYQLVQCPKYQ